MSETATCAKCMYTAEFPYTSGEMVKTFFDSHDCNLTKLQEAIERVRKLHKPMGDKNWPDKQWCQHCEIGSVSGWDYAPYPCDTIKALDGEQ